MPADPPQNQTKIDAFKAKAKAAQADLTAMQSNTTLTGFCAAQKTMGDCRLMAKWQKMADMAKNQTALDAKFKGNETKIQQFQAKVAGFQSKLDAMMGNATLMDTCKTISQGTHAFFSLLLYFPHSSSSARLPFRPG